jgi:cyclopropane fatty-acyl-phospholipid synthase-like methyltransferase
MYDKKLSLYYDNLYSGKDYKNECELIKKYSLKNSSLLDVGCGTMTHTIILSEYFKNIMALDLSPSMLSVAEAKIKDKNISNITTICAPVQELNKERKFDTAISMFNVINHIRTTNELLSFFKAVSELLNKDGVFIFDCWNGIACTLDKPREKTIKEYNFINYKLFSTTITHTDLFNSLSKMKTTIEVYDDFSLVDSFEYSLEQTLWTPHVLTNLLEMTGLNIQKVIPFVNDDISATEKDYRLTFICKKQ